MIKKILTHGVRFGEPTPYIPFTKDGTLYGIVNMLDLVKYRLSQIDAEAAALKAYVTGSVR